MVLSFTRPRPIFTVSINLTTAPSTARIIPRKQGLLSLSRNSRTPPIPLRTQSPKTTTRAKMRRLMCPPLQVCCSMTRTLKTIRSPQCCSFRQRTARWSSIRTEASFTRRIRTSSARTPSSIRRVTARPVHRRDALRSKYWQVFSIRRLVRLALRNWMKCSRLGAMRSRP